MYRHHDKDGKNQQARNLSSNYQLKRLAKKRLLVTADVVPSSLILCTLLM
jgi:hypothetical protein